MTSSPLRIGLTGGIGSGKSTVCQVLRELGAAVIDADAISRSLTQANGMAMPAIEKIFGPDFVDVHGALNRERMRHHVFANPQAKQTLESIVHPLVAAQTARQAQLAIEAGQMTLVFDVPLLVESGRWRAQVDRVLVVDCQEETQIGRVMTRSQLSRETVQQIMASQASRHARLCAADWVIYNDQITLSELHQAVKCLPIDLKMN